MHCVDELCLFIWHGEISITSSKQSSQCLCWPPSSCGPGRCPEMEKEKKLTEEKYPANMGQYWRRLWKILCNIVIKVLGKYLVNIGSLLALGNVFYTTRETWMGKTESRTGLRLPSEKPSRQSLKKKRNP